MHARRSVAVCGYRLSLWPIRLIVNDVWQMADLSRVTEQRGVRIASIVREMAEAGVNWHVCWLQFAQSAASTSTWERPVAL